MEKKQDGFSCYILGRSYDLEENGAKQDYSRALMWYMKMAKDAGLKRAIEKYRQYEFGEER